MGNRALSVPEKHQLRIARDTLKMSDAGALIMGGPSKEEAHRIIQRLTGKPSARAEDKLNRAINYLCRSRSVVPVIAYSGTQAYKNLCDAVDILRQARS